MSAPKIFQSDDTVLDPAIKSHISTLYAAVDKFETMSVWGDHFTEDAILKKGPVNIQGRGSTSSFLPLSLNSFPNFPIIPS